MVNAKSLCFRCNRESRAHPIFSRSNQTAYSPDHSRPLILVQKANELASMLLLISELRDTQVLRYKVKTVAQMNDFFVLFDGCLFCINHTFDNSDHICDVGRRLQGFLDGYKLGTSRDDSIDRLDSVRKLSRISKLLCDIRVQ